MCLIIARQRDAEPIPAEYIARAIDRNPDGFGVAGKSDKGKMYLNKDVEMADCERLIRLYEDQNFEFIAHFRLATHGRNDEINTHPFRMSGVNFLAHNGILDVPILDKAKSDTWHFVSNIIRDNVAMKADNLIRYLDKRKPLLNNSKFAFLGESLPLTVYNEHLGFSENGCWYSNYSSVSVESLSAYRYWNTLYEFTGEETLSDLMRMRESELSELCGAFPDEIARIIKDEYFDLLEQGVAEKW